MPILFETTTPDPIRDVMSPNCLGVTLRQTIRTARGMGLRERVSHPDQRATPAPNPKSTFSRIHPVNPATPSRLREARDSSILGGSTASPD